VIADPGLQSATVTASAPVLNYVNTGGGAHFASDQPFPGTVIGPDINDFVILATTTVVIPQAGLWTFGVSSDDGFGLTLSREPVEFSSSFTGQRPPGDTLAVWNIPEAGAYALRLVFFERGGGSELELFAAQGSHASFNTAFRLVGDTAGGGLPASDLGALIGTDVRTRMDGVNTSIWSRVAFQAPSPMTWDLLSLELAYEDGFVAYLNGAEVASRNAPSPVLWSSAAASDRPVENAAAIERIDLSGQAALVVPGTNVLAIHGLNESVTGADFLIRPGLLAADPTSAASPARYFPAPTPGGFNSTGYPGVAPEPVFSHASAVFADPFDVVLSTTAQDGVIRYTLDGSDPTASSPAYTAPLSVADSVRARARVFVDGLAPSAAVTRLYAKLEADVTAFTSNLPIVVVDTFGSTISDGWLTESLVAVIPTSSGGRASIVGAPDFQGATGIKLRGSSSLGFAKKQYALETWDERRQDLDVSFLGLPPESDWILHGPYNDKTLLRNVLAYRFSNAIGRYAVRTRLVEAYLRTAAGAVSAADYVGVYVLMEKIKVGPDRVSITKLDPADATDPAVTGGYLLKKDRLDPGDSGFYTSTGQRLAYVDPKESEITAPQAAYILGYLNEFESVLYGPGFADPENGYAKYIDPGSFIDHHIVVEMTKNIDGFRLSTFLFKDRLGKLQMGPVWDYDLSQGNANYLEGWLPTGWYHDLISDTDYPWYRRLFEDPELWLRYADRWYELRRGVLATATLLADIDAHAALLAESQVRNFERWDVLGIYLWPNYFIGETYESEIDWMKDWLEARLAWIDGRWVAPPAFNHEPGEVPFGFGLTVTAPEGSVYVTLDGSDPRLPGGAVSPSAIPHTAPIDIVVSTTVRARSLSAGVWSAENHGTFAPVAPALVNEVLPVNGTVLPDEHGDFDPWIELYNLRTSTVDLSGLYLTDDPGVPAKWPIPPGTSLCGRGTLVVWADGETNEGLLHASFSLDAAGGTVLVHDSAGRLVDTLAYPPLPVDVSYGRVPDGGASLVRFLHATPDAPNSQATTRVLLNEYNAVSPDRFLAGNDTFWGHVIGNGGDWFELVVVEDHLDLRGWSVVVNDNSGASLTTLVFTGAAVLSDLRSGTIVTVAEELVSDASYDPAGGDWWIQLASGMGGDGLYVSAVPFNVSNQNTQITILDASGAVAFGPAGEGIQPATGIGSDEVFKLEESPGPTTSPFSSYQDGTSSTFGSPNRWNDGASEQDFGPLRSPVVCSTDASCDDGNPCTDDTCVLGTCASSANTAVCDDGNTCTGNDRCEAGACIGDLAPLCCVTDCDCDDGTSCTTDACIGGTCAYAAIAEGSACSDGDACTTGDTCVSGVCEATPVSCDDLDACSTDSCSGGACLHTGSGACGVAGTVRYYRDGALSVEPSAKPVPGAGIDVTGDDSPEATTDAAGAYGLPGLFGTLSVTTVPRLGAPRAADHNGAVTSYDAARIASHAVGGTTLSRIQEIAADVTGDGTVSALDAADVAQFAVELVDHFEAATSSGSDWRYFRCDRYVSADDESCDDPVFALSGWSGTFTGDFYAVLLGDVTGNWSPAESAAARGPEDTLVRSRDRETAARIAPVSAARAPLRAGATAVLGIEGWTGRLAKGARHTVSLTLRNAEGIEAVDLRLVLDPSKLSIVEVAPGALDSSIGIAANTSGSEERIAAYALVPLRGSGALLTVTLEALEDTVLRSPFTIAADANEGRTAIRIAPVPAGRKTAP
jgi:hypothetical protein